jgi:RNA polymerase-associated protein CTR9/transcription factor SPN1
MPFKSEKQRRYCWYLQSHGQNKTWDCEKWEHETKDSNDPKIISKKIPALKSKSISRSKSKGRNKTKSKSRSTSKLKSKSKSKINTKGKYKARTISNSISNY